MPATDDSTFAASMLETKFFAPSPRDGQIERPRLIERMNRRLVPKLTLVSAPPGFGKSTLVGQWIAQLADPETAVAWVSLDERDNQPETFWLYVVAALERAAPGVGGAVLRSLRSGEPPPIQTLLTPLVNEISGRTGRIVLVLDDFHVIEDLQINQDLGFFLEHSPPNLSLVVVSRTDPAIPLARMRARGELVELRAADLRLTAEETNAFLQGPMGIHLAPSQVAALESRTEGWVAALQLAALSLQGRDDRAEFVAAFSGDDRYVVDYLVDEVLRGLEPAVREFLLRTAILERLSAPLCDAVTGGTGGRAMIELLERRNLFLVPLDDQRRWYRYHHLFADVLRAHLFEREPGEVDLLHQRASEWYAAHGESDRAIRHAIAGRDFARAAQLIAGQAETVVTQHHPDRLLAWLRPVPEDVIAASATLSTYYGHALQGMGDMEGSARWLDIAERAFGAGAVDAGQATAIEARIALGRGYLSMVAGDIEATVAHASKARSLVSKTEPHWYGTALSLLGLAHWWNGNLDAAQPLRAEALASFESTGDDGLAITSAYHDAEVQKARGRLREAERRCEGSLRRLAERGAALRSAANLHIGLSDLFCERNDLQGAERALGDAERLGVYPPRTPFRYLLAQARIAQCRGRLPEALELLERAEQIQVRGAVPDYRPVAAWRARIWIMQGRLAETEEWIRSRRLSAGDELTYPREYEHITLARLLLARAKPDDAGDATDLLQRLLASAVAGGRLGTAIELRVLLAQAYRVAGRTAEASDVFRQAVEAAEPERFARVFLDEGDAIAPLLREAAKAGVAAGYCGQLLAALQGADAQPPLPPAGFEPLSEREKDVLRLLASELSGPEMANALFVSLNTLRTHTKNIYAKLGVTTRRAAVRRATELGLL